MGRQTTVDSTASQAVSLGDVHATVRIVGTIVAERSAILRAPRITGSRGDVSRGGSSRGQAGRADFNLTLLHLAKPGTHVKAGDVVVEFDPENQLQRVDDYEDSVVQLRNSIRKMMANLAATKEAHEQKVRAAQADWQKALLDARTVPVRTQIDAEKMRLTAEEMELQFQRLTAQRPLVEESQRASIRDAELSLQKSALELERARNNLKRMSMTAPIDGIVVMASLAVNGELRQIRDGDPVSAGQPVLHIVDTGSMVLNATANQVDAQRMRLGMRAAVSLDAYPEVAIPASVVGIGAMARLSTFRASYVGELPVRLRIHGRDSRLLPDLTGSAEIVLNSEHNILLAPRQAVFSDGGKHFVFTRQGQGWSRKEVVTGLENATHVAIRAGLDPGAILALRHPL
jgi:multidrug efflux pump subunit AcrA (membrane-fusion protein)